MKRLLLKTPLAKPLKDVQASFQKMKLARYPHDRILDRKTVYCISPYKTGTTFLSSGFSKNISAHEPLQHVTMLNLERNFDDFFIQRLNYLNLKLECSGFLSAYVNSLAENHITKELQYICILREPGKWITSVLNYWETLDFLNFDFINELFWKKKVNVDLIDFKLKSDVEQATIITNLADYYLTFTEDTFKLKNIKHVHLYDLEEFAVNEFSLSIDEVFSKTNVFKRENKKKKEPYGNDIADSKYQDLLLAKGIKLK